MKAKIYRCNCKNVWSIQNRKIKLTADSILLIGDWMTELKPERKVNPKGFVTTKQFENIVINPSMELIENYIKISKLIYNKADVSFNFEKGGNLYFTANGACYLLIKK